MINGDEAHSLDVMFMVESLRTQHHLKEKPFYALFMEFLKYKDTFESDGVPCSKTIKNHLQAKMVGITLTFEYRNKITGRTKKCTNMDKIPRKKFGRNQWQLIYTIARVRAGSVFY